MDWPIAAMSMLGYGLQPADQAYIQLNLVHFSLQRDFFELHPVHDLNAEDSASLRASLHQHFAQSGFECLATPDPHVLLVPIKRDMEVSTRLMSEVWGRDTRHYMPEGSDALPLRLLINEAQMILHEHPVNSARESQGLLAVNSIWLSGGGRLPEPIAKSKYSFFSSSPFIQGLAALTQAKHDQVPANFDALMPNQQTLLWLTQHQSLNQNWFEPILKALKFGKIKRLSLRVGIGDAAFFLGGKPETFEPIAAKARVEIGRELKLSETDSFRFAWIVDFPMYEKDATTGKIDFSHNPFSMPQGGMEALQGDPLKVLGYQYDLACNGYELISGAIRNHRPDIMYRAFEIAGYPASEVDKRFGGMVRAFKYGAPPHGGCAAGIDRIVMLLADEANIRQVIMFPMTQRAEDLLLGAPSDPTNEQLRDLGLRIAPRDA
jgi:hypothetical protein